MTTQNWQEPATLGTENLAVQETELTGSPSAASTAKDEAKDVAREGAGATKHVAGTAAAEARNIAQETGTQAKNLADQFGTHLKDQAGAQQQKVAEGLRSISDELRNMAQGSQDYGPAASLVDQAARRTENVANWLEARDPGSLLAEVEDFGRRRPGAFLAIAAGAGLLAGRLTRGIAGVQSAGQPAPAVRAPQPAAPVVEERTAGGFGAPATAVGSQPTATGSGPFNDPSGDELTILPGAPLQATDPDRRLP
ncbi:hypothetical protein LVY72_02805 [Arthrobacter sp. I2-34]|uniref:Uncharacterized protein n=1 Tax=Arthrobacter hankyongi TaxID=2904801 RepID=A0ABS9L2L1_9MICC|nr:hypothetical protein [Arthrobacter hankyongi]MCG2620840.1 hypothetical protein [Arthrobacter hankyongi]